ncbi:MAG: MFS transporter, partial [Methylotenera sp.]
AGGALGGYLSHRYGLASVFIFCSAMMLLWLIFAYSMQAPPAVKTKMYSLDETTPVLNADSAASLNAKLVKLIGVIEAVVLPQERTVILKIDKSQDWDEAQVHKLLRG